MKSSKEIRNIFLQFFKQKLHQIVKSAPVVVKNDPTLMFTNAGMNQFKDIFLGLKPAKFKRVTDTQKCLRVSGKHNDLEEVGHDTYHHTLFEMLGNWSFGDYYKEEAIDWAWELLTEGFEISPDRIYASIFGGDKEDGIPADDEATSYWKKYLPEERILPFGKKDNFWEMGDVGPSGPCSEIHLDLRSDEERAKVSGKDLVNEDHPEVVEIWNLVFIQFNRKADGSLEELPQKHVDTGMGFERVVMALQNKQSSYDTDLFDGSRNFLQAKTGLTYSEASEAEQIAIRVIMDHIRAVVFAIGDGQRPENTGAGYVIRRILRRASRYGFTYLGLQKPFMYEMVPILAEQYRGVFDEVEAQQDYITRIIKSEEESFLRTLESGSKLFDAYLKDHKDSDKVDGDFAFMLYDTKGFPIDLTELMAREQGRTVDMDQFHVRLEEQKKRSRDDSERDTGDWVIVNTSNDLPIFKGYDVLELETRILQYRTVSTEKKSIYQLVLEETPFYAESGGQIGDRGLLKNGEQEIKVLNTQKENELIIHYVDKLPEDASGSWKAEVFKEFRQKVTSNHSATHLLHAALRETLGTHVEQKGSLVSDKALRFDFSHFEKVTPEEVKQIEDIVNAQIAKGIPLEEYRDVPIDDAKKMGAMALFGEKYGEQVRVIVFDQEHSVELCGGTHVGNTRDIRLFKLVSESSIAAGVRRVEAYTGSKAFDYLNEKQETLSRVSAILKDPKDLEKSVGDLVEKNKELEKALQKLNAEKVGQLKQGLLDKAENISGINIIRAKVDLGSSDDLKQLSFELKRATENTLVVLGAVIKDKPQLSVILSDDLAEKGNYHAGNMVRELAKEIKGGGGGQPFFATAGGKDANGIQAALEKVTQML